MLENIRPFFNIMYERFNQFRSSCLTLSQQSSLSYRNKYIDLLCKLMDLFLYDRDLRYESVQLKNNFFGQIFINHKKLIIQTLPYFFGLFSKITSFTNTYSALKNDLAHTNVSYCDGCGYSLKAVIYYRYQNSHQNGLMKLNSVLSLVKIGNSLDDWVWLQYRSAFFWVTVVHYAFSTNEIN